MDELGDEARALLERYRRATAIDDAAVERALTRALTRAEGNEPRLRGPRPRRWRVGASAAAVLLMLGTAGLAYAELEFGWLSETMGRTSAAEYERASTPSPEVVSGAGGAETSTSLAVPPMTEQPLPPPAQPATEVETPPPKVIDAAPRKRSGERQPTNEAKPTESTTEVTQPIDAGALAEESRLLARARKALAKGEVARALEWAEEHERRFPDGLLAAERMIVQAAGLCRSDRTSEGRALLDELSRRHPGTPASAQVEAACEPQ